MTLIVVSFNNERFHAFSDIMLSSKLPKMKSAKTNPIQLGIERGLITPAIGVRQKTVIRGNHLFLWAGIEFTARCIIGSCLSDPERSFDEVVRILNGYDKSDLTNVELIYCHNDGAITQCTHINCYYEEENGMVTIIGGSGAGDILWDQFTEPKHFRNLKQHEKPTKLIMEKFGESIHRELNDAKHHEKFYGGGYELTSRKSGGGFEKINYLLHELQRISKQDIAQTGFTFYQYIDELLFIISFADKKPDTGADFHYEVETTFVKDILNPISGDQKFNFDTLKPILSLMYYCDNLYGEFKFSSTGDIGLKLSFESEQTKMTVSKDFSEYMKKLKASVKR
jgi:hypothetical protein